VANSSQLSPGAAIGIGLACGGMGSLVILIALGVVGTPTPRDAPPWVGVTAGLVFVLAGLAVIVGYGVAGGAAPDGDLAADTPLGVRAVQYVLGLGIAVGLAVIATWAAFGPGPRAFTATSSVGTGAVGETSGRVVFGAGAVLMWLFTVILGVVSLKRLRRARRA
jgi:hypothetical protein